MALKPPKRRRPKKIQPQNNRKTNPTHQTSKVVIYTDPKKNSGTPWVPLDLGAPGTGSADSTMPRRAAGTDRTSCGVPWVGMREHTVAGWLRKSRPRTTLKPFLFWDWPHPGRLTSLLVFPGESSETRVSSGERGFSKFGNL